MADVRRSVGHVGKEVRSGKCRGRFVDLVCFILRNSQGRCRYINKMVRAVAVLREGGSSLYPETAIAAVSYGIAAAKVLGSRKSSPLAVTQRLGRRANTN